MKTLRPKAALGFTLIELVVVIVISVILALVAIPNFTAVTANNKALTTTNDLVVSLNQARSEAIKRGTFVSLCPANATFTACSTDWTQGWLVFVNPDQNSTFANNASEILIRTREPLASGTTITAAPNLSFLTFDARGFPAAGTPNVSLTVTTAYCKGDNIRNIQISVTGRLSLTQSNCP